jgi:hypothetical protein
MKGFVFDIKKLTMHDRPGIRTEVFLKRSEMQPGSYIELTEFLIPENQREILLGTIY